FRPRGRRDRLPGDAGRVLRPADRGRRPAPGALTLPVLSTDHSPAGRGRGGASTPPPPRPLNAAPSRRHSPPPPRPPLRPPPPRGPAPPPRAEPPPGGAQATPPPPEAPRPAPRTGGGRHAEGREAGPHRPRQPQRPPAARAAGWLFHAGRPRVRPGHAGPPR